jgi:CheY-like chemotaxis protein
MGWLQLPHFFIPFLLIIQNCVRFSSGSVDIFPAAPDSIDFETCAQEAKRFMNNKSPRILLKGRKKMTGYDLSKISVLIVEPQPFMRKIIADILRELGIKTVHKASTIKQGLEVFKELSPDLILTDWSPGLNGINFVKLIRQAPGSLNPFVPIIVVTAYTELSHVFTARDAGMTEFLVKPVHAKSLYGRIQSVIEKNRIFVRSQHFIGPDRRRRRIDILGNDRRVHANMKATERRVAQASYMGSERRQGLPGYVVPETRTGTRP